MKRSLFLIMALLLATPALGTVTITCTDEGSDVVSITYLVTGEKVRAFALDVSVDSGVLIDSVDSFQTGEGNKYGIFPGTIDLTDPNVPIWGTPVAPSSAPGAGGTGEGTNCVILEMGSLYEPNLDGPLNSGTLCNLNLDPNGSASCNVTIVVETTRGGVVLESGASVSITSEGCIVVFGEPPPACWDNSQCYGDTNGDHFVDTDDWIPFYDGFYKTYPDPDYEPCADFDRDGDIDTDDWIPFYDNFYKSVPPDGQPDCSVGGTWPPS